MGILRSKWTWTLVAAGCILGAATCIPWNGDHAVADEDTTGRPDPNRVASYAPGRQIATISFPQITESSGLACSRVERGVFFTHNDSGGLAGFYAFGMHGEHLGTFRIPGARNVDWEDMASFRMDGANWLLFGDIGDNSRRRSVSTLYLVSEPEKVLEKRRMRGRIGRLERTIRFRYEDGPHDCEALAVDTTSRMILLITKDPRRTVYRLPLDSADVDEVRTAKAIAQLPLNWVTGMDISPDGRRAVVLTYAAALEYTREAGQDWESGFATPPRLIHLPARRQGEAVCYGLDGHTLYLTSEKRPTPLIEVPPIRPATRPSERRDSSREAKQPS
jgi:hypothetical protein